jgi:hypothetical protein
MSEILSPVRVPPTVSPRTAKYVEAMTREGDNFDYYKWLKRVREEEAEAKQARTATPPRDVVGKRVDNPVNTSGGPDVRRSFDSGLIGKPALSAKALRRRYQEAQTKTPNIRLKRWLEKVHCAWGEFQASRSRDAVYEYLAAVFSIVTHYKIRRLTNRLLRHAFKFADRPFEENADSFKAVIRCTSERDIDNKTVSKYARALRYAARRKESDMPLKTFMKEAGGINVCTQLYAKGLGRGKSR